ncbi:MAG: 4Fe-4S binding protein [Clostridia bacterium]|nr:4Fe-4S binding protein [Clostridia bacterium]
MKIKQWWNTHKPTKRRLIQLYAALLFNANLKGFATGRIYQGPVKNICTPGLNCYSCPGASGACPMGALQNALSDSGKTVPYYVIGIILLYGLLFGRWICGFLCPFGLIQDLLHKIKTPKVGKGRITRVLSYFKYVILVFFAIIFPLVYAGYEFPLPGFCKYICPAGTLEGAVGLLSNPENESMLGMLGPLFTWKFLLMVIFLVGAVFMYRFFCRFFCPLGAIYGLFNKISFVGVKLDKEECVDCGLCVGKCKMDIRHVGDHECIQCGECIDICPTNAIRWKGPKILLPPQAIGGEVETKQPELAVKQEKARKRTRIARIVAWVLALAVLGGVLYYYNIIHKDTPKPDAGFEVGDTCNTMDLSVYNSPDGGEAFNVEDQLGKVTVINFWGTWCGPCIAELPHFDDVASNYMGRVTVVAVHSNYKGETAADWIAENYPETSMLFAQDESDGGNGAYYTALGGEGDFPMTIIVNKEGVITFTCRGSITHEELVAAVEDALAQ